MLKARDRNCGVVWLLLLVAPAVAPAQSAADPIPRPPELQEDVDFWIRVYSQITTNEGYLHDERDLGVTYETLRFALNTTPKARSEIVDDARDRYQAILRKLATQPPEASLSAEERRVRDLWGAKTSAERLRQASDSIRFQLGQAERFYAGLVRAGALESHIAQTLANMGLPPEIAALPHVESSFNAAAYSKVGAAGLWQFMRSTGRRYLRIDGAVDERLDPFRSTEAAAQLLAFNYRYLGTWPLALTAYNHGAAGMRRAVEAQGTTDFVQINRRHKSPSFGFASRNFYPSFLAALTIDQDPEKYFGPIERSPEARFTEVALPAYVPIESLESTVGVDRETLRALNPALLPTVWNGERFVPRGYRLRLPASAPAWTSEQLAQRLPVSEQYLAQVESRSHRVRRGETLASIAKRYGLSAADLASLNGLAADASLRSGKTLRLPNRRPTLAAGAAAAQRPDSAAAEGGSAVHVVARGETLSVIARRTGMTEAELLRLNGLRNPNYLYEGQRLTLAAAATPSDATATTAVASAATPLPAPTPTARGPLTRAPVARAPAASTSSTATTTAMADTPAPSSVTPMPTPMPTATPATAPTATPATTSPPKPAVTAATKPASPSAAAPPPASTRVATATQPAAATVLAAVRESQEDRAAATAAARQATAAEPVSAAQAEALGPALGPGATMSAGTDAIDYGVAGDRTIQVAAAETLGHYADWLGVSAGQLRKLNQLSGGQPVLLGRKLKLDFSRVSPEVFEQRRREYHYLLEAEFFAANRIVGTEIYVVRRGDSLWSITQRYPNVPSWLVQQYNPDLELAAMRPGSQIVMPRIEEVTLGAGY